MSLYDDLYTNYKKIADSKPIILNITNSVTQDFMANVLLAIGASPIMSEDISEIGELVTIASSININIGTLNPQFNELAMRVAILGKESHKPIILDPVGAGATLSRTSSSLQLVPYSTVICGNASEVMALSGATYSTAGVDTRHSTSDAKQSAEQLAWRYSNTIIISGETDLIISSRNSYKNYFGNPLMSKVTGMGCVLNSVIAAFTAVNKDYAFASYLAVTFYTLCAQKAITIATTPAKFKIEFIDMLYAPDWEYIKQMLLQGAKL